MTSRRLPLYEEILLLALDDNEGTITGGGFYCNAMGGAILAELAMTGSITISDDKKKKVTLGRRDRLEKLTSGQLAGKATKEAVQAVQAAIMVTTIMPAVFAASRSGAGGPGGDHGDDHHAGGVRGQQLTGRKQDDPNATDHDVQTFLRLVPQLPQPAAVDHRTSSSACC
jgi:hypothetical protein